MNARVGESSCYSPYSKISSFSKISLKITSEQGNGWDDQWMDQSTKLCCVAYLVILLPESGSSQLRISLTSLIAQTRKQMIGI